MIRVKFNNQSSFKDVNFTLLSDDAVLLSGNKLKSNNSGFKAYSLKGFLLGDYSDFTNCKPSENGFIFSK